MELGALLLLLLLLMSLLLFGADGPDKIDLQIGKQERKNMTRNEQHILYITLGLAIGNTIISILHAWGLA